MQMKLENAKLKSQASKMAMLKLPRSVAFRCSLNGKKAPKIKIRSKFAITLSPQTRRNPGLNAVQEQLPGKIWQSPVLFFMGKKA